MDDERADLESRLRAAETQIEQLKARIAALERLASPRVDNPSDQTAVREKVAYDWQR
jgi:hypothetical protein